MKTKSITITLNESDIKRAFLYKTISRYIDNGKSQRNVRMTSYVIGRVKVYESGHVHVESEHQPYATNIETSLEYDTFTAKEVATLLKTRHLSRLMFEEFPEQHEKFLLR